MTLWSEIPEPRQKVLHQWADDRYELLRRMAEDSAVRLVRYLVLTNAGGAITIISFMGASDIVRDSVYAKFALALFVIGLILIGIAMIQLTISNDKNYTELVKDQNKMYLDEISWEQFRENNDSRIEKMEWINWIAAFSGGCFIVGAGVGVWNLFFP